MKGKGLFALPAALALAVLTVTLLADCPAEIESGGEAPAQTFTVTLNKEGGTGGISSVKATLGSPMSSITQPTRMGYIFSGY